MKSSDMQKLRKLFDDYPGDDVCNFEQVHGVITAVQVGPQRVMPDEYLPFLFCRDGSVPHFILNGYSDNLSDLVTELKDHIKVELDTNRFKPSMGYTPSNESTQPDLISWSLGFIDGMGFWGREWFDEDNVDSKLMKYLSPIIYFADRGKTIKPAPAKHDHEVMKMENVLIKLISPCILNIRAYWKELVHNGLSYDHQRLYM